MKQHIFVSVLLAVALLVVWGCGGNEEKEIKEIRTSLIDSRHLDAALYYYMQVSDSVEDYLHPTEYWQDAIVVEMGILDYGNTYLRIKLFLEDSTFFVHKSLHEVAYFKSLLRVGSEVNLRRTRSPQLERYNVHLKNEQVPFITVDDIVVDTTYY